MQELEHTTAGEPVAAPPLAALSPAGTAAIAQGRGVLESDRQEDAERD